MKKYIKGLLIRFSISMLIIFFILTVFDKLLCFYSGREKSKWLRETDLINIMNQNKLQNSKWHTDNIIYKKLDDGQLPDKGTKKRILIVGDSVVWGHGASNANHLWWKQLDKLLYENGYDNVEIVAAGTSGYSTKQELDYILKNEKVIEEIKPDLIIIGYIENDPEERDKDDNLIINLLNDNDLFYGTKNKFVKLFRLVWPDLYCKVSNSIGSKYSENEKFQERFGSSYDVWSKKILSGEFKNHYFEVLRELRDYINNNLNIPFFFFPQPTFPQYRYNHYTAMELFDELNITYYDFMQNFQNKYPNAVYSLKEWGINPGDSHHSVKVNLFYAEEVLSVLEKDYSSIIGEKSDNVDIYLDINDWMPYSLKPTIVDDFYEIKYPSKSEQNSFLTLPIHKDYVKLNLRFPIKVKSIEITGDNIKSIELYTNSINKELGYDDQVMKSIGVKKDKFVWTLDGNEEITSINISASIKNNMSTNMYIKIDY